MTINPDSISQVLTLATKNELLSELRRRGYAVMLKSRHDDDSIDGPEDGQAIFVTDQIIPNEGLPRIVLSFRPEEWINDYACQSGGLVEFDGTEAVLKLSVERLIRLDLGNGDNDDLADYSIYEIETHSGPFEVYADEGSVSRFFKANGFDEITEDALAQLRARYGVVAEG
jgi:hypothetical protein